MAKEGLPKVTHSDLSKIFDVLESMKNPPALMIYGVPGIGKSQSIRERFGKNSITGKKYDLRIKYLSRMDPTDWSGVPQIVRDHTEFFPPKFLAKPEDPETRVVLFFDEINTALPQVLNSALDIILEKKAENAELPENTLVICAGNLGEEDGTYVEEFSSAVKTRMIQVVLRPNFDDWLNWAVKNDIHDAVIEFLKENKNLWLDLDGFKNGADQIPTPRGWERVSEIVKKCKDDKIREIMVQGAVGLKAGDMFNSFLKEWLWKNGSYDAIKSEIYKLIENISYSQKHLLPNNFGKLFERIDALIKRATVEKDLHEVFKQVAERLIKLNINVNSMQDVDRLPEKFIHYLEQSNNEEFVKLAKTLKEKFIETRK